MLDPTNDEAVSWMIDIIREQLMLDASSSGWMADFGEYLPFDAVRRIISNTLACMMVYCLTTCT